MFYLLLILLFCRNRTKKNKKLRNNDTLIDDIEMGNLKNCVNYRRGKKIQVYFENKKFEKFLKKTSIIQY